jgi:hypothetical protein
VDDRALLALHYCNLVRLTFPATSTLSIICESKGRLIALPASIRLGWKCQAVANTLAFNTKVLITPVKSFVVQTPSVIEL